MKGRLHALGLMWRFALVGATVGMLVGAGIAWYIDQRLTDMALGQTAARAIDQVELATQGRIDLRDTQAPHTVEKRVRLSTMLSPLVERVQRPDSGLLRVHLFAPDGTIIYSDEPDVVGVFVDPAGAPLLKAALDGNIGSKHSTLSSAKAAKLRQKYDGALEVYVPFKIDGKVVGAYEVYHDLSPVRAVRPLVWSTVTGGFALLFAALMLVVRGAASLIGRQQSEQVRLVEQAAEAAALRRMDAVKNELISVVNHELRTPLASVVGFTELLMTRKLDDARRGQFVEVLHQESVRLTSLVDEFLDLQRIETGRQQIVPVPTDLCWLLERAVAGAGDDPNYPTTLEVDPTLHLVHADVDRVRQVLANLLSNAHKYSPAGGAIRVRATRRGEAACISVADEGLGIPSEAMPRLFEKFFRIDNSDRRRIKGTGLGLAIVREIVHAHGGSVWAESDGPGAGSTFSFTLPIAEEMELDIEVEAAA
jgi:signal transduction histidine kinase